MLLEPGLLAHDLVVALGNLDLDPGIVGHGIRVGERHQLSGLSSILLLGLGFLESSREIVAEIIVAGVAQATLCLGPGADPEFPHDRKARRAGSVDIGNKLRRRMFKCAGEPGDVGRVFTEVFVLLEGDARKGITTDVALPFHLLGCNQCSLPQLGESLGCHNIDRKSVV